MTTIPQKELRNNVGEILRRGQAEEEITITVQGREGARLGPGHRRQWVNGPSLEALWRIPAPQTLTEDLDRLDAAMVDPFR
jgi:prevent-host-death family protein